MGQVIRTSIYSTRKWVQEWCNIILRRIPESVSYKVYIHIEEINPEYSLGRLILKLKLLYLGHPMQRADSLEKTLMLGKIESRRKRGWQRMRWLDGIINTMDRSLSSLGDSEGQGSLVCWSSWGCRESDMAWWLNNDCQLQSHVHSIPRGYLCFK